MVHKVWESGIVIKLVVIEVTPKQSHGPCLHFGACAVCRFCVTNRSVKDRCKPTLAVRLWLVFVDSLLPYKGETRDCLLFFFHLCDVCFACQVHGSGFLCTLYRHSVVACLFSLKVHIFSLG